MRHPVTASLLQLLCITLLSFPQTWLSELILKKHACLKEFKLTKALLRNQKFWRVGAGTVYLVLQAS
jgi:hypothetical protein